MKIVMALCLAAANACGPSQPAPAPNCETALRKAVKAGAIPAADEQIAQLVNRCITERWTATVRACVSSASRPPILDACITGREGPPSSPPPSVPPPSADDTAEVLVIHGGMVDSPADEGELNLQAIAKTLEWEVAENGAFVIGTEPLTPTTACCAQPGGRCDANPGAWDGRVWSLLMFSVPKAHRFQYSYESDGRTFVARAVGDLDCDGSTITYFLRGQLIDGSSKITMTRTARPD